MNRFRAFSLSVCLFLTASLALAQMPGGPPPGGMPGRERGGPGQGMGILPPGTFWKNPEIVKDLNLTPDQQKQMDGIFHDSRVQLIQIHASLEEEQLNLEPLLNATPFDQSRAYAEIAKIADLRASLEKADAKMLLQLRAVLTPDQWTKFQTASREHQNQPRGGFQGRRNRRGPDGAAPTGAPNSPPPPPGDAESNSAEQP